MSIREIMTPSAVVVSKAMGLVEAARLMQQKGVGFLLVTSCGRLSGVVTDRDMVVRGMATGHEFAGMVVADVMTSDVISCDEQASVEQAADLMAQNRVRRVVVTNHQGIPVGVVTLWDIASRTRQEMLIGRVAMQINEAPKIPSAPWCDAPTIDTGRNRDPIPMHHSLEKFGVGGWHAGREEEMERDAP